MSGSNHSLSVLRPLYKQLLTLAWRFDAQPSLKALIHVHPFGKRSDAKLLRSVLSGSKVMYWPSSKGGNHSVSITDIVRQKFRETETTDSQSDRISDGFRALKFLNERIAFARHLELIGSVESLPNTKYLKRRKTTQPSEDLEPFSEEELPKEGYFLLAHPQVSEPFSRKLIYLSQVSDSADGEVVGLVLNDEHVVRHYNLHGTSDSGDTTGNDTDTADESGSTAPGGRTKAVWRTKDKRRLLVDQISRNRRRQSSQPTASDADVEKKKRENISKGDTGPVDISYSQFTQELEEASQRKFSHPRRKFHSDSSSSSVQRLPVYSGGPVTTKTFCMLSPRALGLQKEDELSPSSVSEILEQVDKQRLSQSVKTGDTGLFGSVAMWSHDQLLKELSLGYWIVVSHPYLYDVFQKCTKSKMEDHTEESDRRVRTRPSTRMWEECLKSLGPEFAAFTEIPDVELASHEKAPEDYQPDEQALRSFIFDDGDDDGSGSGSGSKDS